MSSVRSNRAVIAALLWKEWREQRWRLALGALVVTALAFSLVRAQIIGTAEALLVIFGPIAAILAIFLAMGPVATEREDGTWGFLLSQPASRATILHAKWLMGALYLTAALLIAGGAAHVAADSRGVFDLPPAPPEIQRLRYMPGYGYVNSLDETATPRPPALVTPRRLWSMTGLSLISMLALYTLLFTILTRARNELHAGLGGMLVALAVMIWLLQYPLLYATDWAGPDALPAFWFATLLNPLSPLMFMNESALMQVIAVGVSLSLWVAALLWAMPRLAGGER